MTNLMKRNFDIIMKNWIKKNKKLNLVKNKNKLMLKEVFYFVL